MADAPPGFTRCICVDGPLAGATFLIREDCDGAILPDGRRGRIAYCGTPADGKAPRFDLTGLGSL